MSSFSVKLLFRPNKFMKSFDKHSFSQHNEDLLLANASQRQVALMGGTSRTIFNAWGRVVIGIM